MEFIERADDEAGADFDRALSGTARRRGESLTDQEVASIRRHAETMAWIVVEMYRNSSQISE